MEERYYLKVEEQMRGPYTLSQVRHMVSVGIVEGNALFWVDGMDDPRPVGELFVQPVRNWKKVIVRMSIAIVLVIVGFLFTMLVIGPETGAWWESTRLVQFLRKLIYIVFFKQDT